MFNWLRRLKERPREPYSVDDWRHIMRGQQVALALPLIPSVTDVCLIHKASFEHQMPRAGQMRQDTDKGVLIGRFETAASHRIGREFDLLRAQWETLPLVTTEDKAKAIAFYHLRFEAIHPFSDGNGRVGRMILARQAQELLGVSGASVVKSLVGDEAARATYYAAFDLANPKGVGRGKLDLAPMSNAILAASALSLRVGYTRVPYRLPPFAPTDPYESRTLLPSFRLEFEASKLNDSSRHPFKLPPTLNDPEI